MGKRQRSKRPAQREAKRAMKKARFGSKPKGPAAADDGMNAGDAEEAREAMTKGMKLFEEYYAKQDVLAEEDLAEMVRVMKRPLPVAFRVCSLPSKKGEVDAAMRDAEFLLDEAAAPRRVQGITVQPPVRHGWVRGGAWQLGCDDKILRTEAKGGFDSDLGKLHAWVAKHNGTGVISRQEIASMIPVALLGVSPSHEILDLCASPGSKTTQALEDLCQGGEGLAGGGGGYIVANELVPTRAYVLARRCMTLGAAAQRMAVTCHRAQIFPGDAGGGRAGDGGGWDRIICDVPCSGDGTFRKYRDKWGHWLPHQGRALHSLQLQIALRAASLLKVGGLMTYSTCSLNPMEDESVVAAILERTGGALSVVRCREALGDFKTAQGLQTWKVMSDDLDVYGSLKEVNACLSGDEAKRYRETMWPPEADGDVSRQLRDCVRLYPHLNNTGGFFVCLLKKTRQFPQETASKSTATEKAEKRSPRPPPCLVNGGGKLFGGGAKLFASFNVRASFFTGGQCELYTRGRGVGGGGSKLFAVSRGLASRLGMQGGNSGDGDGGGDDDDDDDDDDGGNERGLNYIAAGTLVARRSKRGVGSGSSRVPDWSLTLSGAQSIREGLKGEGVWTVEAGRKALCMLLTRGEFECDALGLGQEVGGEAGRFVVEVTRGGRPVTCFPARRTPRGLVKACLTEEDAEFLRQSVVGPALDQ